MGSREVDHLAALIRSEPEADLFEAAAVAEMERDLLIERTNAGLARARRDGKQLGRPKKLTKVQIEAVRERLGEGHAVAAVAREFNVGRATVIRAREAA